MVQRLLRRKRLESKTSLVRRLIYIQVVPEASSGHWSRSLSTWGIGEHTDAFDHPARRVRDIGEHNAEDDTTLLNYTLVRTLGLRAPYLAVHHHWQGGGLPRRRSSFFLVLCRSASHRCISAKLLPQRSPFALTLQRS